MSIWPSVIFSIVGFLAVAYYLNSRYYGDGLTDEDRELLEKAKAEKREAEYLAQVEYEIEHDIYVEDAVDQTTLQYAKKNAEEIGREKADSAKKGLVPGAGQALSSVSNGKTRLIEHEVPDALDLIPETRPVPRVVMHKVGQWELREEDFQQLQVWARLFDMEITVEDLADHLASTARGFGYYSSNWVRDGRIEIAVLSNLNSRNLPLELVPSLRELECASNFLREIDLSRVPNLQRFSCAINQLEKLNLTPTPHLDYLEVFGNSLEYLDLRPVPHLLDLGCELNDLTELDIAPVPDLMSLNCSNNSINFLDLKPARHLHELYCWGNNLLELDLTNNKKLITLQCSDNTISDLDLSGLSRLEDLGCQNNSLEVLDIRPCPLLRRVDVDASVNVIQDRDQVVEVRRYS